MHAQLDRPAPARAVILAGGASRRMPAGKPGAQLWGRTLLDLALHTATLAQLDPVICARPQTPLPPADAELWREPATGGRPHPLAAIAYCLQRSGQPLVFLPVDLPLLPPAALRAVASAGPLAVLARDGRPAALVLIAGPEHATALAQAASADAPVLRTLVELGAQLIEPAQLQAGNDALTNVNSVADLASLAASAPPAWRAAS